MYFVPSFRYLVMSLVKGRELSTYFTSALFQDATKITEQRINS